jgi:hypothetical protein
VHTTSGSAGGGMASISLLVVYVVSVLLIVMYAALNVRRWFP